MIGFIELYGPDRMLRIDLIRSIGPEKEVKHGSTTMGTWTTREHAVRMETLGENGERYTRETSLHSSEVKSILQRPTQLIPALPGTSIVRCGVDDGVAEIWSTPVVAWALCLDGKMRPVTPNAVNDGMSEDGDYGIYVELPCGTIESVGEVADPCGYDNRETMLRDNLARHARKPADASSD